MDLGFCMASRFNLLFANDILSPPSQTYSCNFHHKVVDVNDSVLANSCYPVYVLGDISKIHFNMIKHDDVDVVVGGPPCQDFSVVRGPEHERQGVDVRRGRLYSHFVRALMYLQPKAFVFENVPGLKSANKGFAYETILEDFSNLNVRWNEIKRIVGNDFKKNIQGYEIIFAGIVDSSHFGVPQRRRRLIVIGLRKDLIDWITADSFKTEAEIILLGKNSLLRKYPLTPIEVFEGLPLSKLNNSYRDTMKAYVDIAGSAQTERGIIWRDKIWRKYSFNVVEDYLSVNKVTPRNSRELDSAFKEHVRILKKIGYYRNNVAGDDLRDRSSKIPNESMSVLERLKMIPPDENHIFVKGTEWEVEGRGMSLIYRRLHPLKPAYTIVAYGGGGTWGYHYRRDRGKLTNRERARLQSFPDDFLFKGSTSEVRAQIGEAVPPLLGEKIAHVLELILDTAKTCDN